MVRTEDSLCCGLLMSRACVCQCVCVLVSAMLTSLLERGALGEVVVVVVVVVDASRKDTAHREGEGIGNTIHMATVTRQQHHHRLLFKQDLLIN